MDLQERLPSITNLRWATQEAEDLQPSTQAMGQVPQVGQLALT